MEFVDSASCKYQICATSAHDLLVMRPPCVPPKLERFSNRQHSSYVSSFVSVFQPLLRTIPSEYNVGLALLRLGKILSPGGPGGSANPAVDCRVLGPAGQGEAELPRRCLPLTPPWWPIDLDPATGKVSA